MGYRMFSAALDDKLTPSYVAFRADEVRQELAEMFAPGQPTKIGWAMAKKVGWKIVRVKVELA